MSVALWMLCQVIPWRKLVKLAKKKKKFFLIVTLEEGVNFICSFL